MIKTFQLQPGVTFRCCTDTRFKMNTLSFQLVRPMCREEASANALCSAVLLRGTENYPDLRDITLHLDDLYGATVGSLVRRVGDYQTTGVYCGFTEDRFALNGDEILRPILALLQEVLLRPRLENGVFCADFVEGEKKNMLAAMEAQKNDKRIYASNQLMKYMCSADSSGIPRLGEPEQAAALEPEGLYDHYCKILRQSRIDIFYVGSQQPERIISLLMPLLEAVDRDYVNLPEQTLFCDGGKVRKVEQMDVTQGKLQMGFVSEGTLHTPYFVPMQMFNSIFGAGMTNKLFDNIREKMSLCYDIGSSYQGGKGILTVGAGMEFDQMDRVEQEVLCQLENCRSAQISQQELESARQALLSSLRSIHDSPSAIENYYSTAALSGLSLSVEEYARQIRHVSVADVAKAAQMTRLHSVFCLKGVR